MAQRVLVQLIDDLDGSTSSDIETVQFSLDGVAYEIDLNGSNSAKLRDGLAAFVASGRRTGGRGSKKLRGVKAPSSGGGHSKEQSRAIREWARSNGHDLADRGRIPAGVVAAFEEAHS
jgi:hypothetical protein